MTTVARWISIAALAGTIVPPLLFLTGRLELEAMKTAMLLATLAWFSATPFWLERDTPP